MTLLPDLETQLRDAARRTQPQAQTLRAQARRGLRPRRRTLVIALAVAVLLASAAVAAVTISTRSGAPAPKVTGLGSPYDGPGRVLPGQPATFAARAADPAGGLAWGLRWYRTSRRAACFQVGRVLDGRLGVLGRDGLLGDDGLFHALSPQVDRCRPLDGAGRLFAVQNALALDNGVADRMTCRPASWARDPSLPTCPSGSARLLLYGFLGPELKRVTLTIDHQASTVRAGPGGAYLFVVKLDDPARAPEYTVTATYADGTTRPADDVAPPGYVDPLRDLAPPAQVRAPLHVTHRRLGKNTIYRIAFRSPVAVHRYGVAYSLVVEGPRHGSGRGCTDPMDFRGFETGGDVRRGERVAFTLTPGIALRWDRGWCPGRYRATVVLHDRAHPVGSFAFTAGASGSRSRG